MQCESKSMGYMIILTYSFIRLDKNISLFANNVFLFFVLP